MVKKIIIGFSLLIVVALLAVFAVFYKSDLTREDLSEYVSVTSRFADLPNGASMHYRDEGNREGKVLVMIHGGFGSLQNWEGWIPYLKDDYRLISMDLLGHGLTGAYPENVYTRITERDAVHMLLQSLGVDKYTVAGNSFGGGIALEMALAYPDEVEGLILVDSEGIPNGENGYDASIFTDVKPVGPDDPAYKTLTWLETLGSKFIGPAVIREALKKMIYNHALITEPFVRWFGRVLRYRGNREAQLLMFRQGLYLVSLNPQDLLPRLPEIKCSALIMAGREDTLVPLRVEKKFKKYIKRSKLVLVDEAGHMPMIEKPKETAEVISVFMRDEIGRKDL
ncbi:hydrolase [Fulvitalea axinellae]|uniref:Hydrolase n=1 Tax=Fulvitalea axinellae TaxID=1182444 RepID=A0AAU9D4I4_9BACT|nr:hydrolase [Fulvitalea axinellae]